MEVTVKVQQDVARALHQRGPQTAESQKFINIIGALGVTLEPMHSGTEDPQLMSYFVVKVPDSATAQRVLTQLQQSREIEAAYVKPRDEMP